MNLKCFFIRYSETDGSERSSGINRYLDGKEALTLNGHRQFCRIDIDNFFPYFE
jgi:hypothetical protein